MRFFPIALVLWSSLAWSGDPAKEIPALGKKILDRYAAAADTSSKTEDPALLRKVVETTPIRSIDNPSDPLLAKNFEKAPYLKWQALLPLQTDRGPLLVVQPSIWDRLTDYSKEAWVIQASREIFDNLLYADGEGGVGNGGDDSTIALKAYVSRLLLDLASDVPPLSSPVRIDFQELARKLTKTFPVRMYAGWRLAGQPVSLVLRSGDIEATGEIWVFGDSLPALKEPLPTEWKIALIRAFLEIQDPSKAPDPKLVQSIADRVN